MVEVRTSYADVLYEVCGQHAGDPDQWIIDPDADPSGMWIHLRHELSTPPQQGWKLHVSATLWSAEAVLRRALAVLFEERVSAKVTATPEVLLSLNQARTGHISQIGKFITVYPVDDDQAVRMAVALDSNTRGLSGPMVPSDRPLRRGSLVHYRYGGFGGASVQTSIGLITPAVRTPAGTLVPDVRPAAYVAPDWVKDPFEAAGVAEALPAPIRVIGGRYVLVTSLQASPRGSVHLGFDKDSLRGCVVKQARAHAQPAVDGSDARDRLRHEAVVLTALASDDRIPRVVDLVEQGDHLFLVMEDLGGEPLEEFVAAAYRQGAPLPVGRVVDFGRQLAALLGTVHAAGYVYRDLKPTNILVAPDGQLRIVDFELAHPLCDGGSVMVDPATSGAGTPGYMSPQQADGAPPAVTDDIYSLGALLFLMATGAEPSRAPHPHNLLERPLALLNPTLAPRTRTALEAVLRRCIDPEAGARYPSAGDVAAALSSVLAAAPTTVADAANIDEVDEVDEVEAEARGECRGLAHRLAGALCADARPVGDGRGVGWVSANKLASGLLSRDIYVGSAGTLLALAESVADIGDPAHRAVLTEGARWLVSAPGPGGAPLAGLYVGESGVATALLRAGQVLADETLIAAAAMRSDRLANLPLASPDLINGKAGRVRFHLLLWDETCEPEHLRRAVAEGGQLLESSEQPGPGERCWLFPPGYGDLSGTRQLGYGHGAAGIADVLLDLYEATGDDRFSRAGREAGRWLARQKVPMRDATMGLGWPMTPGGRPMPAYWCHGAAGIGQFFLHAAALDLMPAADELWKGAAQSTARCARWIGPTQCHGLAGSIEFLLDAYQQSGNYTYLSQARTLSRLLMTFRAEDADGIRWASDWPWVFGPDLLVGYAGVGMTLLRLADPQHRPHGLGRRAFRRARRPPRQRLAASNSSDSARRAAGPPGLDVRSVARQGC